MKITRILPPLESPTVISHRANGGLNKTELEAVKFINEQARRLHELAEKAGYSGWDLYTLGGEDTNQREGEDDAAFKARLEGLQEHYAEAAKEADEAVQSYQFDPKVAAPIIPIYQNRQNIRDLFLRRQIEIVYPDFSEYTVDPALWKRITDMEIDLSVMYGDFKALYKGKELNDAEVEQMIRDTKGSAGATEAIELVKAKLAVGNHRLNGTGSTIAETILEAIKLRNQYARKAGSANYYSYSLELQEINEQELIDLLKRVKEELKPIYDKLREKMDAACMKRYGISQEEARLPWFQGGINSFGILEDVMSFSSNEYFKGKDPRPLLKETARKIGANADSIVDKSDLFPRPGKNPHWYLFPLRVPDDIRSFGNIDPSFQVNMGSVFSTELHEVLGHGVGYSFVSPDLPDLFRGLDTIITESDAMMMEEGLIYNEHWLREVARFDEDTIKTFTTVGKQYNLAQRLVEFFQKFLLITDFEREMYNLSDEELTLTRVNKLWASKVHEYLGIKIPEDRNEPDWTYKIHFATAPVYYQCYFLGQLVRAQVTAKINELSGGRGLFSKATGDFLRQYRQVGETYPWNELVEYMTGKPLDVEALKAELSQLGF